MFSTACWLLKTSFCKSYFIEEMYIFILLFIYSYIMFSHTFVHSLICTMVFNIKQIAILNDVWIIMIKKKDRGVEVRP